MNIVLLKCESNVRFEESKGDSIGLPSQEVMTFARSMSLHPAVKNVYIMTKIHGSMKMYEGKIRMIDVKDAAFLSKLSDDDTHVIFWNGYPIFYGGKIQELIVHNYLRFNEASNKHRYIVQTDNRLPFINLKSVVEEKNCVEHQPWDRFDAHRYAKDVTVITQSTLTEVYEKIMMERYTESENVERFVLGPYKEIVHLPLHLMPLFTHDVPYNENPEYDLAFTTQTFLTLKGYRRKTIRHYFGEGIQNEFITILVGPQIDKLGGDVNPTVYNEGVKYHQLKHLLNKSIAQMVISEESYEAAQLFPNRIAEGVAANVVNFIHQPVDKDKALFGQSELLSNFLYVKDQSDMKEKLAKIKSDPKLRREICDQQRNLMGAEGKREFVKAAVNLFKSKQNITDGKAIS